MSNDKGPMILEGLQIGAVVFGKTRRVGPPVLMNGITATNSKIQKTMDVVTSNSQYIHTANLNEANLSVTGSYGVSGVSQVKAGLSATVSREASNAKNALSISMQRFVTAGIEYIDFDALSPEAFIASLVGAPDDAAPEDDSGQGHYNRMMAVLSAYQALIQSGNTNDPENLQFDENFRTWLNAKEEFFKSAGELLTVGIVWGGWGGVRLSFDSVTSETLWKGGVTGEFSYAGTGASVGVSGSFGHTELNEDQMRSGRVERISHGKCVEPLVDKWEEKLQAILLKNVDTIGKTSIGQLGSAPIPSIPEAPDTVKRKSKKGVSDAIAEVKDLDGLNALAKAQAFDAYVKQAKADGVAPMSLDAFLRQAAEPNDLTGLDEQVEPVDPDTNAEAANTDNEAPRMRVAAPRAKQAVSAAADPFADFVAVGAWFVPWGQIFPWLAEPQFNAIPSGTFSPALVRLRTLASDLETLARTYHHADALGLKEGSLKLYPKAIANAFDTLNGRVKALLNDHLGTSGGKYPDAELDKKLNAILAGLARDYRKIYRTWIETPFLRKCELGAGISISWEGHEKRYHVSPTSFKWVPPGYYFVEAEHSGFDRQVMNLDAFAENVKGIPLVLPSGEIVIMVAWEADQGRFASGLLAASAKSENGCHVSTIIEGSEQDSHGHTRDGHVILFTPKGIVLSAQINAPIASRKTDKGTATIVLDAIPFTAARNITWRGASSAVGVSDMMGNVNAMQERLGGLTQWSLGNEYWQTRDNSPTAPLLNLQALKPFYVGLTEEPYLFNHSNG